MLRRLRREDLCTTTINRKGSGRVYIRRSRFIRIHIVDDTGHHLALGDSRRHEDRKLRMGVTEASVVRMFHRPIQPPYPPWLSYAHDVKIIKLVRTGGRPGMTYKRIMRHSWLEIKLRIKDRGRFTRRSRSHRLVESLVGSLH